MIRVQIETPFAADDAIVRALRAAARALEAAEVTEAATAPVDSYSLTVHVVADKEA